MRYLTAARLFYNNDELEPDIKSQSFFCFLSHHPQFFFWTEADLTLNKKQKLTAAYEALSRADTDSGSRPM